MKRSPLTIAIGCAAGVVLSFLLLFLFLDDIVLTGFFNYFESHFIDEVGMNRWLAKAVALLFVLPLVWALPKSWSIHAAQRQQARVILIGTMFVFFLSIFVLTANVNFNPKTGSPVKYFAITPEGRFESDQPGFDPKYGIPLKPATFDAVEQDYKRKHGKVPRRIQDSATTEFFDGISGVAKVWFHRAADGRIELYDNGGTHPTHGTPLLPMTREVVNEYVEQQQTAAVLKEQARGEAHRRKYLRSEPTKPETILAVMAVDKSGRLDDETMALLEQSFRTEVVTADVGVLTPEFATDGLFARVFNGESQVIRDLSMERSCGFVLLSRLTTVTGEPNVELQGVLDISLDLAIQIWDCRQAKRLLVTQLSVKGAGFTEVTARKHGFEQLGQKLQQVDRALFSGE